MDAEFHAQAAFHRNDKKFEHYGGRGISACRRWVGSFEAFLRDMGNCPDGMSIDRKNNDGNYTPRNCRWATAKEQSRNQRSNRMLTYGGLTLCASEWAERIGIDDKTLRRRLDIGWSDEKALTEPIYVGGYPPKGHSGRRYAEVLASVNGPVDPVKKTMPVRRRRAVKR